MSGVAYLVEGFSMMGLLYIKEENFWPAMSTYPETRLLAYLYYCFYTAA